MQGASLVDLFTASSEPEAITETIHGVPVPDPYRWLEDPDSPQTRSWIEEQGRLAREYLDAIPGRDRIRSRIREFVDVETYDSVIAMRGQYFFRKRRREEEQSNIYVRRGIHGEDSLLVKAVDCGPDHFTAIRPLAVSPDARLLAFEIKTGGERASRLQIVNVGTGARLDDALPLGYLRGFAFAPDCRSFYYAHEPMDKVGYAAGVYNHKLGTPLSQDVLVFDPGPACQGRASVFGGPEYLIIFVQRFHEGTREIYFYHYGASDQPHRLLTNFQYSFSPYFAGNQLLVLTNVDAPNYRIARCEPVSDGQAQFHDVVPACDAMIRQWLVLKSRIVVTYLRGTSYQVVVFDFEGNKVGEIPVGSHQTVRILQADPDQNSVLLVTETFLESTSILHYSVDTDEMCQFFKAAAQLDGSIYTHRQVWYRSKDGVEIPMFLVGKKQVLDRARNPAILTSYGGFRTAMTPQFSVFVAFLMEHGCVFALPNIRGGSEFGAEWHEAARGRCRQRAFDDFLSAAEWLITNEVAARDRLAIFGGSNSGLLVGAAMTQAPELFRAVVCIAPLLDMVRYHLFDGAVKWKREFGTADDPDDFEALYGYSPYHRVRDEVAYPAVMMVSGDSDQNCNPLHARKMVARLQSANRSDRPIILDYHIRRGHVPVLPLSMRIDALTDRMAFLCDQLGLAV